MSKYSAHASSTEFLIADLALASCSVPSFTLSSLSLLSHVLDNHPPSMVITEATFLPQLLEHIYDSNESEHHTIVVVGDLASAKLPRVDNVKILKWDEVEATGASTDKPALPTPGKAYSFPVVMLWTNGPQILMMSSLWHSTQPLLVAARAYN